MKTPFHSRQRAACDHYDIDFSHRPIFYPANEFIGKRDMKNECNKGLVNSSEIIVNWNLWLLSDIFRI